IYRKGECSQFALKICTPNPEVVQKLSQDLRKTTTSLSIVGLRYLIYLGRVMPNFISRIIMYPDSGQTTIGVANVPISTGLYTLSGFPVKDFVNNSAVFPPVNLSFNVTMCGFDKKQRISATIDKSLFPSEDKFKKLGEYIREEILNMLYELFIHIANLFDPFRHCTNACLKIPDCLELLLVVSDFSAPIAVAVVFARSQNKGYEAQGSKNVYENPASQLFHRRQTVGECFEVAEDEEELEANIKEIFQDSSVTECYTGLQKEEIYKCLTGNMLMMEEGYKNVTAEFCPTWSKSKQCLFRYLNSRCNDREVGLIEKSAAFNSELALPSLMCEPGWTVHLQGILKQSREFGLWDCFTNSTEFLPRFQKCTLGSRYIMNGMFPEYTKGIHKFARCIKTALNTCAKGDRVKVLQLKSIWSQIEDTFESSYGLFWEQYKNQS
ncbi:unnamed protein product, partial [Allacma fusca]